MTTIIDNRADYYSRKSEQYDYFLLFPSPESQIKVTDGYRFGYFVVKENFTIGYFDPDRLYEVGEDVEVPTHLYVEPPIAGDAPIYMGKYIFSRDPVVSHINPEIDGEGRSFCSIYVDIPEGTEWIEKEHFRPPAWNWGDAYTPWESYYRKQLIAFKDDCKATGYSNNEIVDSLERKIHESKGLD